MVATQWMVLYYILLLSGISIAINSTECSSSPQDLKVTIFSRRNKTGHLIAKVKLEEGSEEEAGSTRSWEVDVDHDATCGLETNVGLTQLSSKLEPPAPDYILVPKLGYFKFHNVKKTWSEAKLICEAEGAHLGIVNSKKEVEIVQELRARLPKLYGNWVDEHVYAGFNDIQYENTWVTIFDQPLSKTGFNVWDNGQPDNGKNGNCGLLKTSTGKLHDISCDYALVFYCEREL